MNVDQRDSIDRLLAERLSHFEPSEVPSWDQFERRRALSARRVRWVVSAFSAVAAAVVVLFMVPLWNSVELELPRIELAEVTAPIDTRTTPVKPAAVGERVVAAREPVKEPVKEPVREYKARNIPSSDNVSDSVTLGAVEPLVAEHKESPKESNPEQSSPKIYTEPIYRAKSRARARWAVGLFANLGYSSSTQTAGRKTVMMDFQVGKYAGEMRFDARELQHDFPVSVGASLQIGLARNVNFETGLSYTYLRSTSKKEPEMSYRYTQTLHYLGIPLSVSYDFLSNRRLDLYVIGGAMIEYAVGGSVLSEVYSNEGTNLVSSTRTAIDTRGLMVSFNAAVGLNVNLAPMVGLYIEPGVSTYLNNDSHPVNFRTQSPVQFNLRAGIKVKL